MFCIRYPYNPLCNSGVKPPNPCDFDPFLPGCGTSSPIGRDEQNIRKHFIALVKIRILVVISVTLKSLCPKLIQPGAVLFTKFWNHMTRFAHHIYLCQ